MARSKKRSDTGILGDWHVGTGPLHERLARALERAIVAGEFGMNERVPSERALAQTLATSRGTVAQAYEVLRMRGLIESRAGSGNRVVREAVQRSLRSGRVEGGTGTVLFSRMLADGANVIAPSYASEPPPAALREELARSSNEPDAFLSGPGYFPRGLPALREAIAQYLRGSRVATIAEQIVVTTGASQALALAGQMYLKRGSTVLVESPSWPGCLDLFRALGATIVPIPIDDEGINPEALAQEVAARSPSLIFVMPTFHNPTGIMMSIARRKRIAAVVSESGIPLVEDNASIARDRDGFVPPIAAFATQDAEILSIGSLAKTIWAGLRIGWIQSSSSVIERIARLKALADLGSPVIDQALATRLFARIGEIVDERTVTHRERRERGERRIRETLASWRWRSPDGGSTLWVDLGNVDGEYFAQLAQRRGVEVVPGAASDSTGKHNAFIRVSLAYPDDVIDEMIRRLILAWNDVLERL